jgi:UDP-N-acetyl-L-fucosamine synthase
MNKKIKIITVVGTRPELIRLSSVISKLDENCDHILVHTGQNYDFELNEVFFNDLGLKKPAYFLDASADSSTKTIANILVGVDEILDKEKPDAFLVLGDTNSCLSLYVAKRKKIPTFHIEAGNRCFDERVPEEINRKIIDHIADINMTYSSISRDYLIKENFPAQRIVKVGSPMLEIINNNLLSINSSQILEKLSITKNKYFVVSCHREEIIESPIMFSKFINTLNEMAKKYQFTIVMSTHPRTLHKLKKNHIQLDPLVIIHPPFGFFDYLFLQINALVTLSDSGTINEEASILKIAAINLRETNERPEAMEEGSTIMVGMDTQRIFQSIAMLIKGKNGSLSTVKIVKDYDSDNFSEKVTRTIYSYINYINTYIWHK